MEEEGFPIFWSHIVSPTEIFCASNDDDAWKPHEFYELISPHTQHNGPTNLCASFKIPPPPKASSSSKDGLFSKLEIKIVNGIKRFHFLSANVCQKFEIWNFDLSYLLARHHMIWVSFLNQDHLILVRKCREYLLHFVLENNVKLLEFVKVKIGSYFLL